MTFSYIVSLDIYFNDLLDFVERGFVYYVLCIFLNIILLFDLYTAETGINN